MGGKAPREVGSSGPWSQGRSVWIARPSHNSDRACAARWWGDAADYDEVRSVYNGMIDKRPLLVARCVDVADVITAVNFARDNGLVLAIRGAGTANRARHLRRRAGDRPVADEGRAGRSRSEDGAGRTGLHVRRRRSRHPRLRPGGAVRDRVLHRGGRADAAAASAAIWRKHGLTIDNLLAADVVLADGGFITANKDRNPDLFWALRGGGGNFGVVTSFLFAAHPVKMVYAGPIFWDARTRSRSCAPIVISAQGAGRAQVVRRTEDGAVDGSVPARGAGQAGLRGDLLLQRLGRGQRGRRWRRSSASCRRRSSTGWARCRFRHAEPVRRLLPQGNAVVLEG